MPLIARVSSLWRNLVHRDHLDRELDDELKATFALLVEERLQAGLSPEQARREALMALGGLEPVMRGRARRVRDAIAVIR